MGTVNDIDNSEKGRLIKIVDDTGFGFQIAAAQAARDAGRWGVKTEVAWVEEEDGGYADLVLEAARASGVQLCLTVECKRWFGSWMFLVEKEHENAISSLRGFWVDVAPDASPNEQLLGGWGDLCVNVTTSRSQFCAVEAKSGRGRRERRVLEPFASTLVTATQAIGTERARFSHLASTTFWIPVILTNARLFVMKDCAKVADLHNGHVAATNIEEVQIVRFHKTLSLRSDVMAKDLNDLVRMRPPSERTVLVCQADFWPTFLRSVEIDLFETGATPWNEERGRRRDRPKPIIRASSLGVERTS